MLIKDAKDEDEFLFTDYGFCGIAIIRQILKKRYDVGKEKRTWEKHAIRRLRLCSKAMHRM